MFKLISGTLVFYIMVTVFASVMNGGGGLSTSQLTQNVVVGATTIYAKNVTGFLAADYITIDGEEMNYSSVDTTANTFTLASAAVNSHKIGAYVYSPETKLINDALGFNVGALTTNLGFFALPVIGWKFFTVTLPNVLTLQLPFADGDFAFIGYLWLAMTIGIFFAIFGYLGWIVWNMVKPS